MMLTFEKLCQESSPVAVHGRPEQRNVQIIEHCLFIPIYLALLLSAFALFPPLRLPFGPEAPLRLTCVLFAQDAIAIQQ